MKKVVLFIALCFAMSSMAETVFTFTSASDVIQEKDDITIMLDKAGGSNSPYYDAYAAKGPEVRVYAKNTITVEGAGLTNIQIVFAKPDRTYCATITPSTGSVVSGGISTSRDNPVVDTWTGTATSVVFTLGDTGQRVIKRLVVNGDPVNPDDDKPVDPKPLPTEADLDASYIYPEPTIVGVPDTTIAKKEYAFIYNNILVHCDLGTIDKESTDESDPHPAYFNCNAEHTITFTASEAIKGIAISGYVRKAFNATCDHGKITFMTDPDMEMEAWPAIVITDVNNKSVTLSCPKQFRCYELKVYFKDNPEPIWMSAGDVRDNEKSRHAIKLLRNGQILIKRDGQLYNAVGQQLE